MLSMPDKEKGARIVAAYQEFQFKDYSYQSDKGELRLVYAYKDGPDFIETITFPAPRRSLSLSEEAALDKAFRLLFLMAGVSYYKAYVPQKIVCEAFPLSRETAAFCETVYRNGLGEFAFKNKVRLNFHFAYEEGTTEEPVELTLANRCLVPVGGGKDSTVTIETLRKGGFDQTLIACGGATLADPISETIRVAGLPSLHVKRHLSSNLMTLNKSGALNGHVPITAILSSIFVVCAILYDFTTIILSNENSASEPNVVQDGQKINHQYSKSFAFEGDFEDIVHRMVSPSISYFSLLRPLTEVSIAARFSKLEKYHPVFRSCNTAFRQEESARGKKWCCDCPKCRFVFLALAPFLTRHKLAAIFSSDLVESVDQYEGYKELCGLGAHKPFECVGEIQESALLILRLAEMEEWKEAHVVARLATELRSLYPNAQAAYHNLFALRDCGHNVPEMYLKVLSDG